MGYYTRFEGSIISRDWKDILQEKEVALAIARLPYYQNWRPYEEEKDIEYIDDVIGVDNHKWYNYETDMKEISKMFPDLTICIHGEGEAQGDVWNHYFKNGKDAYYRAEMVIPSFNPKDLR